MFLFSSAKKSWVCRYLTGAHKAANYAAVIEKEPQRHSSSASVSDNVKSYEPNDVVLKTTTGGHNASLDELY